MSPVLSLLTVSTPATQALREPVAGTQGDASSPFAAFLGLFAPNAEPALAQPSQPLGPGLKDAHVPKVSDTARLTHFAAAWLSTDAVEQAEQPILPGAQAGMPMAHQGGDADGLTVHGLNGDMADGLSGNTDSGEVEPGASSEQDVSLADIADHRTRLEGKTVTAETGMEPKTPEAAADAVPAAVSASQTTSDINALDQVPSSLSERPGEAAPEPAAAAAQPVHERPPVAAPRQAPRPGQPLSSEPAQPHGPAPVHDGDGPDLSGAADTAGRKELRAYPEPAQADARPEASRPAPDSAGRDPLSRLMEAVRPEGIERTVPKAGPQPVDTPDLVAHTSGSAESSAMRNELPLPSVKLSLPPQQSPAQGLAVQIAHAAKGGLKRFEIRLDPPELGRIEVRLDVAQDGRSSAHLIVERAETLDLLQRDARALERALQNAGLDTNDGSLKFSLKDQGLAQHDAQHADLAGAPETTDDLSDETEDLMALAPGRWFNAAEGGLDIRV